MPDEPAAPSDLALDPPRAVRPAIDQAAVALPSAASWRVDGRLTGLKIGGTAIFALATFLLWPDRLGTGLSGVAAVGLAVLALRDLIAPVRLAADPSGLTAVAGFIRRERLAWEQIERVRVDRRRRLGTVSELLEIDAGDGLYLFSSYDLGESPPAALDAIRHIQELGRVHGLGRTQELGRGEGAGLPQGQQAEDDDRRGDGGDLDRGPVALGRVGEARADDGAGDEATKVAGDGDAGDAQGEHEVEHDGGDHR
jgi:hypothetical protein